MVQRDHKPSKLKPRDVDHKKLIKADLVYIEESPDYCERNDEYVIYFRNYSQLQCNYLVSISKMTTFPCKKSFISLYRINSIGLKFRNKVNKIVFVLFF